MRCLTPRAPPSLEGASSGLSSCPALAVTSSPASPGQHPAHSPAGVPFGAGKGAAGLLPPWPWWGVKDLGVVPGSGVPFSAFHSSQKQMGPPTGSPGSSRKITAASELPWSPPSPRSPRRPRHSVGRVAAATPALRSQSFQAACPPLRPEPRSHALSVLLPNPTPQAWGAGC